MGWYADYPDAENFLQIFYGPNQSPGPNMTNYKNSKYDQIYLAANKTSDDLEKIKLYKEMIEIVTEDCPMIFNIHTDFVRVSSKQLENYNENSIIFDFYKYLDITPLGAKP